MKIFTLTFYLSLLTNLVFSQTSSISIEIDSVDNLKSIVEKLSSRRQYLIAYPSNIGQLRPNYSGHTLAPDISELLSRLFSERVEIEDLDNGRFLIRKHQNQLSNGIVQIKGSVVDQYQTSLEDVLIYNKHGAHTFSDSSGAFELNIEESVSTDSIFFQAIGYDGLGKSLEELRLNSTVALVESPIIFNLVTVEDRVPTIKIDPAKSNTTWHLSDQFMAPLHSQDIIKQMQFMPGVSATDDLSASLKIRGSGGNESLIVLDGIPLYQVDHFFGIFGLVNSDFIHEAKLYKNALPIEYGGRTGGMLSMSSLQQVLHPQAKAETNLLTTSLQIAAPISQSLSISLAGRTSYRNPSSLPSYSGVGKNKFYEHIDFSIPSRLFLQMQPNSNFYDVNAKMSYRPTDKFFLDINYFASDDQFSNDFDFNFLSQVNRRAVTNLMVIRNQKKWSHEGASINAILQLNEASSIVGRAYSTSYQNDALHQSSLSIGNSTENINTSTINQEGNSMSTYGINLFYLKKVHANNFKIGIDLKKHQAGLSFFEDEIQILSGDSRAAEATIFSEQTWKKDNFTMVLGGRSTYYTPTSKWYLDPKLEMTFLASTDLILKASSHYAHQYIRELNFISRLGNPSDYLTLSDGNRYPVGNSFQNMIGLTWKKNKWLLDFEMYHKDMDGTLEFGLQIPAFEEKFGRINNRTYRIYSGSGKVIGLDFLIQKEWKNYTGLVAYTLGKSTRRFAEIRNNQPYLSEDDRRHQFKWLNSFKIGAFQVSANYLFSSGRPYLAIDELPAQSNRQNFSRKSFIKTLPGYERLDLQVDYQFELFRKKVIIGASCFNVTNHINLNYIQYIFSFPRDNNGGQPANAILGTETLLLSRTPNLRLRVEF